MCSTNVGAQDAARQLKIHRDCGAGRREGELYVFPCDRAGNVITIVAAFAVGATIVYVARGACLLCCCLFCLPTCSTPP
jgi:hypothetical protein